MTPSPPDALPPVPFTVAEARRRGLSPKALRGRRFRRLFRGVYVDAEVELTFVLWLQAALLVLPPDAVVSHLSALRLHGLEMGSGPLELSTNAGVRTRLPGVRLHRRLERLEARELEGLPVTGPERTFVDCGTRLGLVALVQAADHLVRTGATTLADLLRYCRDVRLAGVRRARRAVALACDGAESPRETFVRLMLVFARLPQPRCNVEVVDTAGGLVARVGMIYVDHRVVVEHVGQQHEHDGRRRQRDRERRERLEGLGYRLIVVTDEDLRTAPREIPRRVYEALRARGYEGPQPVMSIQWSRWFARR